MKIRSNLFPIKVVLPAVLFSLLLGGGVFFREEMFSAVNSIASPFWKFESVISDTSEGIGITKSKGELTRENKQLRARVRELRAIEIERDVLREERLHFNEILERKRERNLLVSGILAKPPISPYDTFLVDVGKNQGVQQGDRAFMYGNIAIGKVVEVSGQTSKIKLYSSSDEKMQVFLGENNVEVEAVGRGAGNFQAELPRGVEVKTGAKARFPGLEGSVLGIVEHVQKSENDTFQTVFIKSPVDIWTLRYIQIEV